MKRSGKKKFALSLAVTAYLLGGGVSWANEASGDTYTIDDNDLSTADSNYVASTTGNLYYNLKTGDGIKKLLIKSSINNATYGFAAGYGQSNAIENYVLTIDGATVGNVYGGYASRNSDLDNVSAKDNLLTFAAIGGGEERYDTGSHVKVNTWNGIVGIGLKKP